MGGGEHDCSRKFVSSMMDRKDPAIFRSVRNVFLFGRGGSRNLKCIYKFEGQRGERVRVHLRRVTTLNRVCTSKVDEDINRSFCYGDTSARIEVSFQKELLWQKKDIKSKKIKLSTGYDMISFFNSTLKGQRPIKAIHHFDL